MAGFGKQRFSPTRRRIAAFCLILAAILLGIYDAGGFWNQHVPSILRIGGSLAGPFHLGLDLQGGTHLVYQANFTGVTVRDKSEAMQGLRDVIERRVNAFGVAEPVVQVNRKGDDWRLIVELAGVKDINEAIRLIGKTPQLEFKESLPKEASEAIIQQVLGDQAKNVSSDTLCAPQGIANLAGFILQYGIDPCYQPSELTGRYLSHATVEFESHTNQPYVGVEFNSEGGKLFESLTKANVGKRIGIYLDGLPRSAPVVQEAITGGKAQITGQFTLEETQSIVRDLNSGSLPVPIALISQQSVEASLGESSLAASLRAALIGFIAVAMFMVIFYRLPGVLAVLALLIYAAINLAIYKIIPVTMTVAGIAGFILSLGMAVDANILIFERMKEELRRGKELADAMDEGFKRAWTSIRDSNISSLITAAILYYFGTSVVRGFALTLAIGIFISMFSALTVTRTFLFAALRKKTVSLFLYLSGFART